MATNNPLNYTDYDFDSLKLDLVNRLRATEAWRDTYESSTGQMIIEFYAYIANMILHYLERRAEECYWDTAQNKSSIINLARLINYTPKRKISAMGALQFSISAVSTKRISIPQYTKCQTANALKFVTIRDTTIEPGQLSNTVTAIQGVLVELEFAGDGSADQEYEINDTSVENDVHTQYLPFYALRVIVDGVEWTKVTSFLSSDNTDTHYKLRMELDETLTVVFGNDVKGKAPETGSTIQIKYIKSDGADGNVYETGQITTLNDNIYDEDETATAVTVTNSSTMAGGDDAESLEEIRAEAPDVFATGERAVTKLDFRAIIINYESVADVNVWGEYEEGEGNSDYDMFNRVNLCILLDDWNHPTTSFKADLSNDLYDQSLMTVKYEYITATILYVIAVEEAIIVEGNALSQAQSNIETTLEAEFVLGDTVKLGTSKYHSNLVEAVDSLDAVSYHHLTLEIRKELTADYASGYEYGGVLDATKILEESVKVYVGTNQIAIDDGLGGFTDLSSAYSVSGTVNYTTGLVSLSISPTPSETVYIRYQQDEDGNIIVGKNEVCKLYDVEISSIDYPS